MLRLRLSEGGLYGNVYRTYFYDGDCSRLFDGRLERAILARIQEFQIHR